MHTVKRRSLKKVLWALVLAICLFFMSGDSLFAGDAILQTSKRYTFDVPGWEIDNFFKKWAHLVAEFGRTGETDDSRIAQVKSYFALNERANELEFHLSQAKAGFAKGDGVAVMEAELREKRRRQSKMLADVEETLEGMLTKELKESSVYRNFLGAKLFWPPVDIRLETLPKTLVVSRRDRIELLKTRLLDPHMTFDEMEALEEKLDRRNISTLVENIGGVATYPAFVNGDYSLRQALDTAAHEWTHHYLFYHPLGRAYWDSGALTTINETVADIVGREIGRAVYKRSFATPEEIRQMEQEDAERARPPTPSDPNVFDFRAAMRETRLTAERLLGEGKIEEAESYMESRRDFFAQHGYFFRKLNQAYFAFHGSYADSPGSVSPIGGQLASVRKSFVDVGAFLRHVADYDTVRQLEREAGREGT